MARLKKGHGKHHGKRAMRLAMGYGRQGEPDPGARKASGKMARSVKRRSRRAARR